MAALLWDRRRDAIRPLLLIGATALAGVGVLLALDPGLLPVSQVQHNVTGGGFELKWWLLQRMEHGVQAFAGLNEAQPRHGMLEYREFPAFAPSLALAVLWGGLLLAGRRAPADDGRAGTWLRLTALVLAAGLPLWRLSVGVPQPTGLLITSPLVLLLAGAPSEGNARWLYRGSVLFLFLALLTMPNGGGSQIGPRYLLPVVPLLAVLAAAEAMRVLKSTDARPVQLVVRGALGASLFFMLTGKPPFAGKDPRKIIKDLVEKPPPDPVALNPQVPRSLADVCLKCLSKRQRDRYHSAKQLQTDLERELLGGRFKLKAKSLWGKLRGKRS